MNKREKTLVNEEEKMMKIYARVEILRGRQERRDLACWHADACCARL
jgi:hypothetical protein